MLRLWRPRHLSTDTDHRQAPDQLCRVLPRPEGAQETRDRGRRRRATGHNDDDDYQLEHAGTPSATSSNVAPQETWFSVKSDDRCKSLSTSAIYDIRWRAGGGQRQPTSGTENGSIAHQAVGAFEADTAKLGDRERCFSVASFALTEYKLLHAISACDINNRINNLSCPISSPYMFRAS